MRGGRCLRNNTGMNVTRLLRVVLFAGLLGLGACATERHSRDLLQVTLYDYSGAVRWNRFDAAANFLDPELLAKKPLTPLELERYEQIQVTAYRVQGSEQPSPTELRQIVEIRFINRHTQAEHSIVERESWRYDETLRRWWLTSGLPDITRAR
jgi:hypothetical protein